MSLLTLLGERLASYTGKEINACMGILRLSIKDAGHDPATMTFNDWKKVLFDSTSGRLQRLNINDCPSIVKRLVQDLTANQSLLTMTV